MTAVPMIGARSRTDARRAPTTFQLAVFGAVLGLGVCGFCELLLRLAA